MVAAYRLVKARRASTAFDGEGASKFGGRWNGKGVRVVYTSESRSLAAIETLAHIERGIPFDWVIFRCEFPNGLIEVLPKSALAPGWQAEPPTAASKDVGDQWVNEARSAVLRVPSVLVAGEYNYLLNPLHRDFRRIKFASPQPFVFDPRLTAR